MKNFPPLQSLEFNPAEWVTMAKNAGMKYITITSKHHDGFAMFDSKVSDYNIVKKIPYEQLISWIIRDPTYQLSVINY